MYFKDLTFEVQTAVRDLTKDAEFQRRFGTDETLDKLDSERWDPSKMLAEWMCFRNRPLKIGNFEWKHLTIDDICFLYAIENPIIKSSKTKEVTDLDMAIFCYVTQCPDFNANDISGIAMKAKLWFGSTGIEINDASKAISRLVSLAFEPLDFFPPSPEEQLMGSKEACFDSDWCASMISTTHQMTGLLPEQILKMPVAACGWYFIQYAKQNGTKNIGRKSNAQIIYEMDIRSNELIVERLIEKGVIKEEDRDYYLECLKSPSKRRKGFEIRK